MLLRRLAAVANAFVLRGLGSGLTVLFTLLVARYLSTQAAADFLLLLNLSVIGAVAFRWGWDDVTVRRVASVPANGSVRDEGARLLGLAHRRVFLWTASAVVMVSLVLTWRPFDGLPTWSGGLLTVTVSAFVALTACVGRVIQGSGRTNLAAVVLNIAVPAGAVTGLLGLKAAGMTPSSTELMALYAFVAAAIYAVMVWGPGQIRPQWPEVPDRVDRAAANRLGGVVVAQQALTWGATLIVPAAYGDASYEGFAVVSKLAVLVSLAMLAVNFTFAARIAAANGQGDLEGLRRLNESSYAVVAVTSMFAAAVVWFARPWLLAYAGIQVHLDGVLAVLLLGQLLFALSAVSALVLTMCGDESFLLKAQGTAGVVGLCVFGASSIVAPLWVPCAAMAATYGVLAAVLAVRARRFTTAQAAVSV